MKINPSQQLVADSESTPDRLLLAAGAAFGLVYGASFALLTWGIDGFALSSVSADAAWGKLIIGLPLALLICTVVSRRGIPTSAWVRFLVLWPLVSAVLGALAAHLLPGLSNLLVWVTDQRFAQLPIFPYGRPDPTRTGFVVAVLIVLGASVGLVQNFAIDWAWDRGTPSNRLSWRSWLVMLLCVPLAILPAIAVNQLIHGPLRTPQQAVGDYLELVMTATPDELEAAGVSTHVIRSLRGEITDRYTTYLVEFDPDSEAWFAASVDVVFDNGFRMRCLTFGDNVVHCDDLSNQLASWMDGLVSIGRSDGQIPAEFDVRQIAVEDQVVDWLSARDGRLDGQYDVSVESQHGGWIMMAAQFDSGFRMGCYFRNARPAVVDHCVDLPAGSVR